MQDLDQYRLARIEDIVPRLDAVIAEMRNETAAIRLEVKAHESLLAVHRGILKRIERALWAATAALVGLLFKEQILLIFQ